MRESIPENIVDRLKVESTGYDLPDPEKVEREKREQDGYLIKLIKRLGRPLTQNELYELGNIL